MVKQCCYEGCENYRRNELAKYCKYHDKIIRRAYRYDIPRKEVEELLKKTNCDICDAEFLSTTDIQFDHCHRSGKVRGTLCRNCNTAIGKFKESISLMYKAIDYLRK